MTTAIEPASVVALTPRGIITAEALAVASEQRALLAQFVKKHMVEGTDYGVIPGTPKPTLLKPGAEKLTDLFRCTPKFSLVKETEDFERGFFAYIFRVRLYQRDAEAVVAEGFGSANSREGRYRWRNSTRKCPACGRETIIKGKEEYGGGWVCFEKKGGCRAKFKAGDAAIESQVVGQVENDDIATMANTILKMAKKRAFVDGAIALARCSDMFTQDVEDIADHEERPTAQSKPTVSPSASPPVRAPGANTRAIREGKPYVLDKSKSDRAPKTNAATVETTATKTKAQILAEESSDCPPEEPAAAPTPPAMSGLEQRFARITELVELLGDKQTTLAAGVTSILGTAKTDVPAAEKRAEKWIGILEERWRKRAVAPPPTDADYRAYVRESTAAHARLAASAPPPLDAAAPGADSQEGT